MWAHPISPLQTHQSEQCPHYTNTTHRRHTAILDCVHTRYLATALTSASSSCLLRGAGIESLFCPQAEGLQSWFVLQSSPEFYQTLPTWDLCTALTYRHLPTVTPGMAHLEPEKEAQVLRDCQTVKQYVVLGTDAKTLANLVYVGENVKSIDGG